MANEEQLSLSLDANRAKNYFFALFTVSQRTGEIIGYQEKKLYKRIYVDFEIFSRG